MSYYMMALRFTFQLGMIGVYPYRSLRGHFERAKALHATGWQLTD
jgi:hypothetical protein